MAVPTGIEPAISCVTGRRDNRYTTGPYYTFSNIIQMVTRTGFEPVLPPWKGGVLTTWPTGQKQTEQEGFEPSRRFPDLHP